MFEAPIALNQMSSSLEKWARLVSLNTVWKIPVFSASKSLSGNKTSLLNPCKWRNCQVGTIPPPVAYKVLLSVGENYQSSLLRAARMNYLQN